MSIVLVYLIGIIVTYVVIKFKIRTAHEWTDIVITLLASLVWPASVVFFSVLWVIHKLHKLTETRKPPKWL